MTNTPPKIFLMYASAGSGHRSACESIKYSLLQIRPDAEIKMVDILDYMPRIVSKIYSQGYLLAASKFPMLWYFIYESGSDLSNFKLPGIAHRIFWHSLLSSLFQYLRYEKPDYIVSTHFLSSWAAGYYKKKINNNCRTSTVITDYGLHPAWITAGQDVVFVATEQLKAELRPFAKYFETEKIESVGIPIHPKFGVAKNVDALRAKYKIDGSRPTLLILGGMFGAKNIKFILSWLSECHASIQVILVAGKYYPIPEYLKEKMILRDIKYQLYGYVDFMDDLMAIADVAITKAGALTTSECLASGLPLIIFRPYPGQEERNCDYFLEHGVAVKVDQLPGLCYKIDSILNNAGELDKMRTNARQIAKSNSSEMIAKMLLELE